MITESFSAHAFVAPLARYLDHRGWDSVIACSGRSYDDARSFTAALRDEGFEVRDVDIPRHIDPINDLRQVGRLVQLIRQESPTVVHTHLAKGGIVGRVAAGLTGVPCVHTVYDYAFVEHRGIRRRLYRGIEQVGARLAQRILFVSENERQVSLAAGIGSPEQLVNIGFGIDTASFNFHSVTHEQVDAIKLRLGIPEGRPVVGTVARLVPRKGIDRLLEAAAILATRQFDAHLLVVGGGPIHRNLMSLAWSLGLAGRVSFTGFIDDQLEMPALFSAMDVFCLPSRREGYGMVYAEAGAMRKPVVGPEIPPINTIVIDGVTGLLVPAEDPRAIAYAIVQLLSDESLRLRLGVAASEFVRANCDMRDVSARVLKVYTEVVGGQPPGRWLRRTRRRRATRVMSAVLPGAMKQLVCAASTRRSEGSL